MYEEQEKGLGEVSIAVDTLHHMSNDMNDELLRQEKLIFKKIFIFCEKLIFFAFF